MNSPINAATAKADMFTIASAQSVPVDSANEIEQITIDDDLPPLPKSNKPGLSQKTKAAINNLPE